MPTNIFSSYKTGENRVTASILAVLQSLSLGRLNRLIGALLESRGLKVTFLKLDPYLNVDPGTMSPFQHEIGRASCRERV